MRIEVKFDGLRDIEKALAKLPAGTAKGVARRAMKKELAPVASYANALWPGADDDVFTITSRIARSQMGDSLQGRGRSFTNLFVGASRRAPQAHLLEFGTGPRFQRGGRYTGFVLPSPMLQPAWDFASPTMLEGLGKRLWEEIEKTMARRAKRGD